MTSMIESTNKVPTIHFVMGSTGAGKTTYAKQLSKELDAMRFAVDEWMQNFFVPDWPENLTFKWAMDRVRRCETMIWLVAEDVLKAGKDVVLEVSATTRDLRDRQRKRASQTGFPFQIHFLDVDRELRKERVRLRNKNKTHSYAFEVDEGMFDFVENMFEFPSEDELIDAIIVKS